MLMLCFVGGQQDQSKKEGSVFTAWQSKKKATSLK